MGPEAERRQAHMNICFVNSTNKWGGVKSWTLDVARGLADRGHGILIVGRSGPFIDKAREMGLDALGLSFGPDFNPMRILGFIKLFKARKTDLVVVNVGKDMRIAGIAAKMLGIPVVHRVGLAGDMRNTYKVRLLHKWIRPRILVPCEQIKRGLLQELPYLKPEEITVILTGKEPAPSPPATVHSPLRFISTSQLNADKGHKDVLEALAELKKQGYAFEYHIVGTGRIEAELKDLTTSLDLDDRVTWHGFQKDVRSFLRKADVFLLPSYREGLPNTLLEAMAEGLVCVARDVGGVAEMWPQEVQDLCIPSTLCPNKFNAVLNELICYSNDIIFERRKIFWKASVNNSLENMIRKIDFFFTH
ncbi:Glycosyltransferase involved in cell wall bisynthesis [Desulfomicrobium norvegicum]|uniref:Glycosyltransferase involved in cell wall bisynthesis n=2 Tax=Desulfomicrobium norvegicum (strain DSM 1741 / NCIMB 8310) TaxID=52561 RepID=A0A8G2F6Q6_DESNO|nr:Glycosyltransferase involved in cell wall bisynthesis [Desulfomicrobium norvegicum]